jgi:membrane protease YdiL (CAAX protease family)
VKGYVARILLLSLLLVVLARGRTAPEAAAASLPWLTTPPSVTWAVAGLAAGALLVAAARLYLRMLTALGVKAAPRRDLPRGALPLLITAVAIGPLVEEATVRGFIMGGLLLPVWGTEGALLLSSLIFGLAHPPPSIPWACGCGLVLGGLTIASGAIWPAVLAHAVVNGWATARLLRQREASGQPCAAACGEKGG